MDKTNLIIEFKNITREQKEEMVRAFKFFQYLGSTGASRRVSMFVDGDGAFRPNLLIHGGTGITAEESKEFEKILDANDIAFTLE